MNVVLRGVTFRQMSSALSTRKNDIGFSKRIITTISIREVKTGETFLTFVTAIFEDRISLFKKSNIFQNFISRKRKVFESKVVQNLLVFIRFWFSKINGQIFKHFGYFFPLYFFYTF
jgi:hypothetical protein